MSYSISIAGHTTNEEVEKKVLDAFRNTVKSLNADDENVVGYAVASSTQFHGSVDLKE